MRIGMLLPSVYMGDRYKNKIFAPKELFLNLANALVDRGHTVFMYAAPGTKTRAHLIEGHEELIEHDFISPKFKGLDRISKLKNAHTATKIEYEIDLSVNAYVHAKKEKVDIMHAYHDFMAHYVNKLIPIPTVYTVHDPRPLAPHIGYWRFKHFRNDNYIFISNSQRKHFGKLIKSVGVIHHGVDINKFSFSEKGGDYLAFVGRYIKEKGVAEAVLAAKDTGVPLKLLGDNVYRALPYYQTKILPYLKKGIIEDDAFRGESDRWMFFRGAKALLFPILWEEPFGMVTIEAMSCGTPVIAFDRGSVREVIKDGETGYLIPPKEGIRGLIAAIKKLQSLSGHEYHLMRVACRIHVEKNFTIRRMTEEHEKLYKRILGG